ncbi:hypothetical protein [Brucella tritici]|uniref:Uncharacterized protein n=1 Tax=Brucella tritici TaxID=94626 RepID=A0A6L3YVV8_9HYPH|nr:hypothetical protein [Brucella tritici]KAB2689701.1 hypothetical protein F9L08_03310 [Brucella tritici]
MINDRTHFAKLMDKWREAEALAELIRQFADDGGRHRLKIKVEHPDPVVAGNAERVINDMMKNNGFGVAVQKALERVERKRDDAREEFLQEAGAGYLAPSTAERQPGDSLRYPPPPRK